MTSRREFLAYGAGALVTALAQGGSNSANAAPFGSSGSGSADAERPNLVFILADDLGWGDLSVYGRTDYRTPRIDSIGRDGMIFTDGYANSCVCTPTRVAFTTGRYQQRLPYAAAWGGPDYGIPPQDPTVASLLSAAGYDTALIGKWHQGSPPRFGPNKSGYQYFYGVIGGGIDYFTHVGWDGKPDLWENESPTTAEGYSTDVFTDRAVSYIEQKSAGKTPFHLSLHYTAPHWPWEGPDDEGISQWPDGKPRSGANATAETYAAMLTDLDRQVGRVLDALEAVGIAENTLVVFSSDNGGERLGHSYPFRGHKGNLYEGGIRVPVLARWPRRIEAGQVSDHVNLTMDWTATLLDAGGARADRRFPLDGVSLLPVLAGGPAEARTVFWRQNFVAGADNQGAVRDGRFKYLKLTDNIEQLYLLDVVDINALATESDPEDPSKNLASDPAHRDTLERLRDAYRRWDAELPAPHVDTTIVGTDANTRLDPGGNGEKGGYGYP